MTMCSSSFFFPTMDNEVCVQHVPHQSFGEWGQNLPDFPDPPSIITVLTL